RPAFDDRPVGRAGARGARAGEAAPDPGGAAGGQLPGRPRLPCPLPAVDERALAGKGRGPGAAPWRHAGTNAACGGPVGRVLLVDRREACPLRRTLRAALGRVDELVQLVPLRLRSGQVLQPRRRIDPWLARQQPQVLAIRAAHQRDAVLRIQPQDPVIPLGEGDPAHAFGQETDLKLAVVAATDRRRLADRFLPLSSPVDRAVGHAYLAVLLQRVGGGDVAVVRRLVPHRQACDLVPGAEVALQVDAGDGGGYVVAAHAGLRLRRGNAWVAGSG